MGVAPVPKLEMVLFTVLSGIHILLMSAADATVTHVTEISHPGDKSVNQLRSPAIERLSVAGAPARRLQVGLQRGYPRPRCSTRAPRKRGSVGSFYHRLHRRFSRWRWERTRWGR